MAHLRVKLILPALTEATRPFWRPIKYSLFPPLGLATLAAYLEEDDEVEIQDEHVEALNLDDTPDLVVIQVYITSAHRACRIADHYRRRGAHVALGGLHVTSLPEEAACHADTIFVGPGEDIWPQFLADFRRRCTQPVYRSTLRTLAGLPPIRPDLIKRRLYLVPNSIVVSRGCPHVCDFCYKEAFFEAAVPSIRRPWTRSWRKSSGCLVATCISSTTTCSATAASPRRSSTACAGWAASGRPPARSTRCSRRTSSSGQ